MKGGTRIAIGVGIGYVLGRTRKMKFALSLAGAAMSRRSSGLPSELLERGSSLLRSSPELTQLTDTVRGELMGAVRSAAVTAASNRIDALNDRIQHGAEPTSEQDEHETIDSDDDEDFDDTEVASEHDEDAEDVDRPRAVARKRTSGSRAAGTRKAGTRTSQRSSAAADRKSNASSRRRPRAEADAAPVRRTRR